MVCALGSLCEVNDCTLENRASIVRQMPTDGPGQAPHHQGWLRTFLHGGTQGERVRVVVPLLPYTMTPLPDAEPAAAESSEAQSKKKKKNKKKASEQGGDGSASGGLPAAEGLPPPVAEGSPPAAPDEAAQSAAGDNTGKSASQIKREKQKAAAARKKVAAEAAAASPDLTQFFLSRYPDGQAGMEREHAQVPHVTLSRP